MYLTSHYERGGGRSHLVGGSLTILAPSPKVGTARLMGILALLVNFYKGDLSYRQYVEGMRWLIWI